MAVAAAEGAEAEAPPVRTAAADAGRALPRAELCNEPPVRENTEKKQELNGTGRSKIRVRIEYTCASEKSSVYQKPLLPSGGSVFLFCEIHREMAADRTHGSHTAQHSTAQHTCPAATQTQRAHVQPESGVAATVRVLGQC